MKRLALVLCAMVTIALCGCSNNQATVQSAEETAKQEAPSTEKAKSVEYKGLRLQVPEGWVKDDLTGQTTLEGSEFWHAKDVQANAVADGGVFVFSNLFSIFGNTDTQMPDPSDPKQQELKKGIDAALKVLDARVYLESIAKAYGYTTSDGNPVDQSIAKLSEVDGHAMWSFEGKMGEVKKACIYTIAFDARIIGVMALNPSGALDANQKRAIDTMECTEKSDALILEKAKGMEGKSQDDVLSEVAKASEIPGSTAGSSGGTSSSGGSGSSSNKKTDSTSHDFGTGDKWEQDEDGSVMRYGEDGSVTRHNDKGVTTFNKDGSKEWTDGWGTVVRDENGDGKPDYVSKDSGETWTRVKN